MRALTGVRASVWGLEWESGEENCAKNDQKWAPKKVRPGPPGRGVLRFLAPGYRNPVHILVIFRVFSENGAI